MRRIFLGGPSRCQGRGSARTRLPRAVDPGDLCRPCGPDGEGQARGQARGRAANLRRYLTTPALASEWPGRRDVYLIRYPGLKSVSAGGKVEPGHGFSTNSVTPLCVRRVCRDPGPGTKAWTDAMDIGEILVLALSTPSMCLLLLILTWVEEWLRDDAEDSRASRPAGSRGRPQWPVRATSHIRHICHDSRQLAKLLVLRPSRPDVDVTTSLPGTSIMVRNTAAPDPACAPTGKTPS